MVSIIFRIAACIGVALGIANMLFIHYDSRMLHLKKQIRSLKQQIRSLYAKIKFDSTAILEEMYHAGWAVIIDRAQLRDHEAGRLSETELQTLRRLRSALEPIRAKVHINNPYDTILDEFDGTKCKYLIHLWFADHNAIVIDYTPEEAIRRAQLYEPNGGWEHASVEIITRVRASLTSRVLALESGNKVSIR